jgi:hypothetical protein
LHSFCCFFTNSNHQNLTMSECMQLRIVSRIPEILQAFLLDARKRNLKERKVGVITKCLIYFSTYKVTLYIPWLL